MGSWNPAAALSVRSTPGLCVIYRKDKLPLKVQVVINSLTDYFVESVNCFRRCTGAGKRSNSSCMLRCTNLCQRVPLTLTPEERGTVRARRKINYPSENTEIITSTANSQVIDFQRWLAHANRQLCPSLPQTPTPLSSFRSLPPSKSAAWFRYRNQSTLRLSPLRYFTVFNQICF